MNTHTHKAQEKNQSDKHLVSQKKKADGVAFQLADNRPEAVAQRKLQESANNSKPVQKMRATAEFLTKHTATSEEEAIEKSKTRTGSWRTNSIMDFGEERTPFNFNSNGTLSGPFSVAADGWEISKTQGGSNFKGTISGRSGFFTGTASKKTLSNGSNVGEANHSDGFVDGITDAPKQI